MHLTAKECWKAARQGVYYNKWFNLTNIQVNIPKLHSYISKGVYTKGGSCTGKTFERNGQEHTQHFERTYITLAVTSHSLRTETGILSTKGFDVILPHNIRMPVEKNEFTDNRMGIMVWADGQSKCEPNTGFTNQFVELFQGDVDLHLKKDSSVKTKYNNALVTVYNEKRDLNALPVTFGYSVRYKTTVCNKIVYQTNGPFIHHKKFKHSVFYK